MNILLVSSLVLAVALAAAMPEISKRPKPSEIDTESLIPDRIIHKRSLNNRNGNKLKNNNKNQWKKKRMCKSKRNTAIKKNIDDYKLQPVDDTLVKTQF